MVLIPFQAVSIMIDFKVINDIINFAFVSYILACIALSPKYATTSSFIALVLNSCII